MKSFHAFTFQEFHVFSFRPFSEKILLGICPFGNFKQPHWWIFEMLNFSNMTLGSLPVSCLEYQSHGVNKMKLDPQSWEYWGWEDQESGSNSGYILFRALTWALQIWQRFPKIFDGCRMLQPKSPMAHSIWNCEVYICIRTCTETLDCGMQKGM